jgi:UDP-3-O-[3-hydroxymyristoyl] N-acetylglucosamine deacetylase
MFIADRGPSPLLRVLRHLFFVVNFCPLMAAQVDKECSVMFSQVVPEPIPVERFHGKAFRQKTIRNSISCQGRGLHTGALISLRLEPAEADSGIVFQRTDLVGAAPLVARYDQVIETRLSTVLGEQGNPRNSIATIEHLMASLAGCGIGNVRIFVDGPEIPVLDGSAREFLFLIDCAGVDVLDAWQPMVEICRTVRVEHGDAWVELSPGDLQGFDLDVTIDFPAEAVGRQHIRLVAGEEAFRHEVAAARTFTFREEIEMLRAAGLARGGSLQNAIVVDGAEVLNPEGLRQADEFVRHKMMDAIGDLSLAGSPLRGRFSGYKCGHALNNQVLRALFATAGACRMIVPTTRSARKIVREAA